MFSAHSLVEICDEWWSISVYLPYTSIDTIQSCVVLYVMMIKTTSSFLFHSNNMTRLINLFSLWQIQSHHHINANSVNMNTSMDSVRGADFLLFLSCLHFSHIHYSVYVDWKITKHYPAYSFFLLQFRIHKPLSTIINNNDEQHWKIEHESEKAGIDSSLKQMNIFIYGGVCVFFFLSHTLCH